MLRLCAIKVTNNDAFSVVRALSRLCRNAARTYPAVNKLDGMGSGLVSGV